MLDLLRKNARSWIAWVLFGGLIVVFIFFFGYNTQFGGTPQNAVARVNGTPILRGEYDLAYANNESLYRQIFPDGIPPEFRENLRTMTVGGLVNQKLLAAWATTSGWPVPDAELATYIQALPFLQRDGAFDPLTYHEQVLPDFRSRYQIPFESWISEQLLADRVNQFLRDTHLAAAGEMDDREERSRLQFTFEIIQIDPAHLMAQQLVTSVEQAHAVANQLQQSIDDEGSRESLLKQYALTPSIIGPVNPDTVDGFRAAITDTTAWQTLFALTTAKARCDAPLVLGDVRVVCRLLERTRTPDADEAAPEARTAKYADAVRNDRLERLLQHLHHRFAVEQSPDFQ